MNDYEERQLLETIDRYLLGQMSGEEKTAFEKRMAKDPSIRQEVEDARTFLQAIRPNAPDEEKEQLDKTRQMMEEIRQTTEVDYDHVSPLASGEKSSGKVVQLRSLVKKYLPYAAAFLVIALIPAYFFLIQQPSSKQLFKQYYQPSPGFITDVNRSAKQDDSQLQAIGEAYESGNYQEALQQANSYLEAHPDMHSLRLYRGVMHLEVGNHEQAIRDFQTTRQQNEEYRDRALWYMALTYLYIEDTNKARETLQQLQQRPPSRFSEKAAKLLDELR